MEPAQIYLLEMQKNWLDFGYLDLILRSQEVKDCRKMPLQEASIFIKTFLVFPNKIAIFKTLTFIFSSKDYASHLVSSQATLA